METAGRVSASSGGARARGRGLGEGLVRAGAESIPDSREGEGASSYPPLILSTPRRVGGGADPHSLHLLCLVGSTSPADQGKSLATSASGLGQTDTRLCVT